MDYEAAVHDLPSIEAGLTSRESRGQTPEEPTTTSPAPSSSSSSLQAVPRRRRPRHHLRLPRRLRQAGGDARSPSSSGPPSTVGKEPESATAPAPSRGRGTSRVTRRRLGHGASVRLQRRARCSRRRGWGCTFKPGTEPTTTATLRRCRGKKGRQGGKRCQRRAATRCRAPGSRRADLHTCEPTRALQ